MIIQATPGIVPKLVEKKVAAKQIAATKVV